MFRCVSRVGGILGVVAALAISGSSARAGFEIDVTETGGPTIPILDGGPLDNDGSVNGNIDVNNAGLNALLTHFTFISLAGTSNALIGGGQDDANLTQTGNVIRSTTAGVQSITIVALEDNFLFPTGNALSMRTSASDTFNNTTAGDSRTFQSKFDASGAGGGVIVSPLLVFVPPVGGGPFSTSNPGIDTPLGVQPIPFALSNTTVITLGANTSFTVRQRDQFTGSTSVRAIPEPGTLALMVLGLPALVIGRRFRRRLAA
jgi:hypothetical protein